MEFTPRPYQHLIRDFALEHERCNIFAGMGMGKTGAALDVFDTLRMLGEAKRTLVLAPKRVALSTWPDEVAKWGGSFGHLTVAAAIGTPAQRLAALRSNADITTINYENIPWLIETLGADWPFDTVIADESTRLKNLRVSLQTSKLGKQFLRAEASRAKGLAKLAHTKVRRWINLTGSPSPNGLQDLWGQMWFVDGGQRLGRSFSAFEARYFHNIPTPDGYGRIELRAGADTLIHEAIRDKCITVEAKDWFDIKQPIDRTILVKLPPKARAIYDAMEDEMFAEIDGHDVEVFSAGAKYNKCLQIGSGNVYVDDQGSWSSVHDEKIDALRSVVEEAGGAPILVSYQFKPEAERILKAFPKKARRLDTPKDIKDFQAGRIPIAVCHPASAGHGLSLQDNCWIICYYSSGIKLEEDEQIIERIGPTRQLQSGYDRAVFRYRIVAEDTIEQTVVLPRLQSKASVQDSLKAAMKQKREKVRNPP